MYPFNFSEESAFFFVRYDTSSTPNQTIHPTRTSRRSDYAHAKKRIPHKLLSNMTEEELDIIRAVNLDDYPDVQKDPRFIHLTSLCQSGWIGKKFPAEMHQKRFIYYYVQ